MDNFEEQLKKVSSLIKHKKVVFEYGKLNKEFDNESFKRYKLDDKYEIYPFEDKFRVDIVGFCAYGSYKIIRCINSILCKYPMHYQLSSCNEFKYFIILDESNQFYLKEKLPLLTEDTLEIHRLLLIWGDEATREVGEKVFTKILKLGLGTKFKKHAKVLYRGFNLSPKALKKLSIGKSVQLEKRLFSSWTENKEYTKKFREDDKIGTIFKYIPTNEAVININLFEQEVFNTLRYYPISREKEIILLNSPKMLILNPNQVVSKTDKWKNITTEDEYFLDINLNGNIK